ncbi:MAG: pyrimidine-nucleoside phosphorylase [Clostridia bacterium]|nr:pyrimidine-nucleoside phosphorylase [Clostridia bacterium]
MRAYDLILKKRNGESLSAEEIKFLIRGFLKGEIPDYQMAAFLMAVYFRGMDVDETVALTEALVDSGKRVDLSNIPGVKVDKHSTGGVGDKATIVLVPLAASAGVTVAKMSGRSLGHTGGTADKLESIPGFKIEMSLEELVEIVSKVGAAMIGQSKELVPGDKKLYALRDVTAVVDSIPLIASSVMSKKIAAGCDAVVLDVKVGSGAFMKNIEEAKKLASLMVDIGSRFGIPTTAVLTRMDQPLGYAVGNSLELIEAVNTLKGEGPEDLEYLCIELGSHMLKLCGDRRDPSAIKEDLEKNYLKSGRALKKFREIIAAQGGDPSFLDNLDKLPKAEHIRYVYTDEEGYIIEIDAEKIGRAAAILGAGREVKEQRIDLSAGLIIKKKLGETVKKGDILTEMHSNNVGTFEKAEELIRNAFKIGSNKPKVPPLVIQTIG